MYSIRQFSAFYSHFQMTSCQMTSLPGHFRSPAVAWRHFLWRAASSCELHPCRKWNIQYTPVFGLLQTVPGDFRWNVVTSGALPVPWGHVTSFPVTWLPPPASCSLVGSEMYGIPSCRPSTSTSRWLPVKWRHFRVTPCHLRSRDVNSCHVTASLLRAILFWRWNVEYTPVYGFLQPLPGDLRSNDVTSGWLSVTWGHVRSFVSCDCIPLRAAAL